MSKEVCDACGKPFFLAEQIMRNEKTGGWRHPWRCDEVIVPRRGKRAAAAEQPCCEGVDTK